MKIGFSPSNILVKVLCFREQNKKAGGMDGMNELFPIHLLGTLRMRHLSFLSFVPANDTAAGANFFLSLQQSELPPSVLAAIGLPLCLSLLSFISLKVAR